MTIHDLEIFEKVVECTNLTLLSKRIGMSQPNISIHLKSLEEELNEKLFERIGKKLIINESGKLLHSKTKDFLLQYNEIKNIFSKNKLEGKINIGSTKTLSIYFLPNLNFLKLPPLNPFITILTVIAVIIIFIAISIFSILSISKAVTGNPFKLDITCAVIPSVKPETPEKVAYPIPK